MLTIDVGEGPRGTAGTAELELPCDARWLSTVRGFVGATLQAWGWSRDDTEVAVLLAGEVAGSAVRSVGRGRLRVVARPTPVGARVSVHDASTPSPLPVPRPTGGVADGGHGLQLLDTLAEQWGTTTGPTGRTVWFEVEPGGP